MNKSVSLTYFPPTRDYREVAQLAWGLTDKQMNGMHVHHQPPRSEGGRNVPEHLYVCSPSIHAQGWHNGEYFIEQATLAGEEFGYLGGEKTGKENGKNALLNKTGIHSEEWLESEEYLKHQREAGRLGGESNAKNGTGFCSPGYLNSEKKREISTKNGKTAGSKNAKEKTGFCSPEWQESEKFLEIRKKNSRKLNTEQWKCTVTGRVSTAGPLTLYQRSVGVDPSNRVKVSQ
jgi:hypothetical protein